MKTIVILTDQLHKIGGINSLIQTKANYWAIKKGYQVHIITTEQENKPPFYSFNPSISLYDLNITYNRTKSYFSFQNLLFVFKNLWYLQKKIKILSPDLVIIANQIPVALFFPLLKSKAKFLKECHNTKYFQTQEKQSLFNKVENYIESMLNFQVVLNKEEKDFYKSKGVVHIPNPISIDINEKTNNFRENVAIAAGRIAPVKRFDLLIEIWSKFKKDDTSNWKLEIYGEGDEINTSKLHNKIKCLGLTKTVEILKPVNNLPEIMKTKGLYLMTSSQECFPMVLLEAQASGLPIISFDCPTGPRNIIEPNETGILIDLDDHELFISALHKMTSDKRLRRKIAENAISSVKKYCVSNVMESWEEKILKNI